MIYRVDVKFGMLVEADSQKHAESVAIEHSYEEFNNTDPSYSAWPEPITELNKIPPEWRDSIPYGRDDEKMCWEILKEKL